MKRGQVGLGLVIFAIVAIIAVIGLVLLFSRASAEGAAIGDTYGGGPYADRGISTTYESPKWIPPMPGAPSQQYPAHVTDVYTKGSRVPAFVIRKVEGDRMGYAGIEDMYACNQDLVVGAKFGNVQDYFSCYSVPFKGGSNAEGFFPPDSSAEPRPWVGRLGGDMYCYARSTGAEQQIPDSEARIRDTILRTLVDEAHGVSKYTWTETELNGERVPVCWVSKKSFPFPQGAKV